MDWILDPNGNVGAHGLEKWLIGTADGMCILQLKYRSQTAAGEPVSEHIQLAIPAALGMQFARELAESCASAAADQPSMGSA